MSVERPFERYFQLLRRKWKLLGLVAVLAIVITMILSGPTSFGRASFRVRWYTP